MEHTQAAAAALLQARREGTRLGTLPGAPSSMAEAVAIQRAVLAGLGDEVAGWKVGAPGPDKPPNCSPLPSGGIGAGSPRQGYIEAEIAVVLAYDLPLRDAPYSEAEVLAAIGTVHPAIEVLDSRFSTEPEAWSGLADGGGHAGLVLGPAIAGWEAVDLAAETVEVSVGGAVVKHGSGNPGGPMLRLLCWMADTGARWDGGLRAGQVVTTGSWTGKDRVGQGQEAVVRFAKCGAVSLAILLACVGVANAQDTRTYDRSGALSGTQRTSPDGTTRFYDRSGAQNGYSRREGSETRFYDRSGSYSGSSRASGAETRFYDRSGSLSGTTRQNGNETRSYDRSGSYSGSSRGSGSGVREYDRSGSYTGERR